MERSIAVAEGIEIPGAEIEAEFSRASGPGGQHVNKTETRVTLRFALASTPSIPEVDRARMLQKLSARLTKSGEILVSCDQHRDRAQNMAEALARLEALLQRAFFKPKPRRPTRPSRGAKERRLQAKRETAGRKRGRKPIGDSD